MDANTWAGVDQIRGWLDAQQTGQDRRLLRVLKIGEEFGEVAEAVHGAMGANPRKGPLTWDDVRMELCDVLVTTLVALSTISDDPARDFDARLEHLVARIPGQHQPDA